MKAVRVLAMAAIVAASVGVLSADVKTQQKTQVKFEGMMGRMVGMFGGKAAKEGLVSTVSVKGDRKMTVNDDSAQIIDLAEEKVYDLDLKKKTYTVTTFAELRKRLEEAQAKAAKSQTEPEKPEKQEAGEPQFEVDFDAKETGQRKAISGYDCREVMMIITVRQKGKTLEQAGGMVMTASSWLAPEIASMNEVAEFDRRYAAKLEGPLTAGVSAEQMAAMAAMYPAMQKGMAKFQAENVNMKGTALSTTMTMEAVKGQEQAAQQGTDEKASDSPRGLGGLMGGLGRKIAKKPAGGDAGNRSTIMTTMNETLSISTDVAAADVAIPAGFKEK